MTILLVIIILIILIRFYLIAIFDYTPPIKKEKQSDHIIVTRFKSYMKKRIEITFPQWVVMWLGFKAFLFAVYTVYA